MGFKKTQIALIFSVISLQTFAAETSNQIDDQLTIIGRQANTVLDIAASVDVIDTADIQQSGATNLAQLLNGRSGIQISNSNSSPVLSMRGFSASQAANNTLILIDGRRLNNIDITAPNLNAISLTQVERVEIMSGSAGVLYGDQAVGGVINIVTKSPNSAGGSLTLSGGNFDTYDAKADAYNKINDNWRYYTAASYNKSDNYRDENANETGSILARLTYETDKTKFFIEGSYYDNRQEIAGALTQAQFNDDPRQATQFGDYTHEITTAWQSQLQQSFSEHWQLVSDLIYSETDVTSLSYGSSGRNERNSLAFNPKLIGEYTNEHGDVSIVAGADIQRGESKFDLDYLQRSDRQTMLSAYVQATVSLTNNLEYVVGGRYSYVTDDIVDNTVYPYGIALDDDAHALSLGVNYHPVKAHRLYARASSNFRFAKVDEQTYTPPSVEGLKPQTGESYEAGWDWIQEIQTLRLNLYKLTLDDEIIYDLSADMPLGGSFPGANVNAEASRRYGATINWDWNITSILQMGIEASYIDAEFTKGPNKGNELSWVAKKSGRAFVNIDINQYWQLYTEAQYMGERYIEGDDANIDDKLDDYWLTNMALNFNYQNWMVGIRADNLFDEKYASGGYYSEWGNGYYVGNGRSYQVSVGYQF